MNRPASGFVPERLTEAREARGLTCASLAELLGVTRQAPSQWESGKRSPAIERISETLRFPMHRFIMPMAQKEAGTPFFRSLATASRSARTRAMRRAAWLRDDICGFLRRYVEFSPVNFPKIEVPDDPASLAFSDIEDIARQVRRFWGLGDGPISDVVLLLENNGAIVARQELGATNLDAFSEWNPTDDTPYIVLGTEKSSAVRSRFDAAHELGHMILHRRVRQGRVFHPDVFPLAESQAHYFAGAFLMPAESFGAEMVRPSMSAFYAMKPRWRVSIAAMIRRSEDLNLLTGEGAERCFTYRSQKGWTRSEPFDCEWEPEQPRFIRRSFDLLLREGVSTRAGIESGTALYAADIENAAGLEPGFFGDDVKHFKFPPLAPAQPEHPIDNYTARLF